MPDITEVCSSSTNPAAPSPIPELALSSLLQTNVCRSAFFAGPGRSFRFRRDFIFSPSPATPSSSIGCWCRSPIFSGVCSGNEITDLQSEAYDTRLGLVATPLVWGIPNIR